MIDAKRSKDLIFIVGMHRSGTSCLTGCLEDLGVYNEADMAHVNKASSNPKGNRESPDVHLFNEVVLKRNGYKWSNIPNKAIPWIASDYKIAEFVLENMINQAKPSMAVVKDPRIALMPYQWLSIAPNAACIISLRHPMTVAKSLLKRSNLPIEEGLKLWADYNREVLPLAQEYNIPVLSYDLPPEQYIQRFRQIAAALGLDAHKQIKFYDANFNTVGGKKAEDTESLPDSVKQLYKALLVQSEKQDFSLRVHVREQVAPAEGENMKMVEMINSLEKGLYPSGKFWVNFGHVLLKTGRPVSAFQAFKKALKMGKINMSFIAGFLKSIYYTLILRKKEN
ncbi:MAG: hypothetical protein CMH32_07370 [Micavibrio sp.]|nr:hypothetical protein [Micavibrio sp.]MAZ00338.1 hypothetical protein [Micavibrio sp.]